MPQTTIKEWVLIFREKYNSKEEFLTDLDRIITELNNDKELSSCHQLNFYKRVFNKYKKNEEEIEKINQKDLHK